ncbi:unnamed protein product [Didymodactylos carnosus]|uniref:Uncharacterized protein n=1 Tax=Didymodactylos carnosus TaxID=1234261 RepID=A0A8S2MZW4_9BILA|nr:unnamed protein product [Didymodactylos carnosus]CAF3980243.1 unnamed protein product [Didymodactylos carnosus]
MVCNWGKRAVDINQITDPKSQHLEKYPYDLRLLQFLSRPSNPNDSVTAVADNDDDRTLNYNDIDGNSISDFDDNSNHIKLVCKSCIM